VCLTGDKDEMEGDDADPNAGRFVRYQFTPQFLKLKTVGATYVRSINLFIILPLCSSVLRSRVLLCLILQYCVPSGFDMSLLFRLL